MNGTLIAVTDKNGFIASESHLTQKTWTSKEDKAFFNKTISNFKLLVMGINTYLINSPVANIDNKNLPNDGYCRVILTNKPEDYYEYQCKGKREFIATTPESFAQEYSKYMHFLLVGGASIYRQFYEAGIIKRLYITVEPVTISNGNDKDIKLFGQYTSDVLDLPKPQIEVLNENGTMLYTYELP